MAHYLFNLVGDEGQEAALLAGARDRLRRGRWPVKQGEPHRDALAVGDLALIYLGMPIRGFVGYAELASGVREPTGDVVLTRVEEWSPPVPMQDVLAGIDTSAGARADFDTGVLRITEREYEVAVALAHAP